MLAWLASLANQLGISLDDAVARVDEILQAGLLVPAQEESLTVRATRSAMAKLDGDPSRLLN